MTELPIVLPAETKKRIEKWIIEMRMLIDLKNHGCLTPKQHEQKLKEKIKRMRERQARRARAGL